MADVRERALGALYGLAIGDALGMPTQSMPRWQIRALYGPLIDGLHHGAAEQLLAPGRPAGSITDDTEQTLIVADLLIAGNGQLDHDAFAAALERWQHAMLARGSADLLGPSTARAIAEVRAGTPAVEAGRTGATNGAAMRAAPVGIAVDGEVEDIVDAAEQSARVTHHTTLGIAGAAAVAAAVSAGVGGGSIGSALASGVRAAELAGERGHWVAGAPVASRIRWALDLTRGSDDPSDHVEQLIGTSVAVQESVPSAFVFARDGEVEPALALRRAASVGGDTDTIAAMAGAIIGSVVGVGGFPTRLLDVVRSVNDLDLESRVDGLLALREGP